MGFFWRSGTEHTHDLAVEAIQRLTERLQTSTLLEDKRMAVVGLRGYSRQYQNDVGMISMDILVAVVSEQDDPELVLGALETLISVCRSEDCSGHLAVFSRDWNNIKAVLEALDMDDLRIKYNVVELLLCIVSNKTTMVRECILKYPLGISRLVNLLGEAEVLREGCLLLLNELASGNTEIQKLIVFEDAFDRLLSMISSDLSNHNLVFDCLTLIKNLLSFNLSNQNYFRESGCIPRIAKLVSSLSVEENIGAMTLLVDIIYILVSTHGSASQNMFRECGTIQDLFRLTTMPTLLESCLQTVSALIRGNSPSQELFAGIRIAPASTKDPLSAILYVCRLAFDKNQSHGVRSRAMNLFESYLADNPDGQAAIFSTWIPSPEVSIEDSNVPVGYLITSTCFDRDVLIQDPSRHGFATAFLSFLLQNPKVKIQALDCRFGDKLFIDHTLDLLIWITNQSQDNAMEIQTLCMVLVTWMVDSPETVHRFLQTNMFLQLLIEQIKHDSVVVENKKPSRGLWSFIYGILIRFNPNQIPEFDAKHLSEIYRTRIGENTFISDMSQVKTLRHRQPDSARIDILETSMLFPEMLEQYHEQISTAIRDSESGTWKSRISVLEKQILELEAREKEYQKTIAEYMEANRDLSEKLGLLERDHHELLTCLAEIEQAEKEESNIHPNLDQTVLWMSQNADNADPGKHPVE